MKMHVPFFLLLILFGTLLIWVLGSSRREEKTRPAPHWADQITDLEELGRYKHVTAAEYTRFAAMAESEQAAEAARLFRALARSESVHEINCAETMRRLGGHYIPPLKVVVFRSQTSENLIRALKQEQQNYARYRAGCIEQAFEAGNRYAARTIIRIAGGDMRQIELLEHLIEHPDSGGYAVCPVCGNIYHTSTCDHYCPFCDTSEAYFIRFE